MLNEDYIKQCISAQDILKRVWKPKEGDRILTKWNNDDNKIEIDYISKHLASKKASLLLHKQTDVWLPYDEQLQKIADDKLHLGVKDLGWNYYWWLDGDGSGLVDCWLEFVMERCFNRTWNFVDKKWVILNDTEK